MRGDLPAIEHVEYELAGERISGSPIEYDMNVRRIPPSGYNFPPGTATE
jgi:hypothetical protein